MRHICIPCVFKLNFRPNGEDFRPLLPHTTKRRTITNLKTKNNQNCQKTQLYGSPTTKELKKKHSYRPVGGEETGSWGGEDEWQGSSWRSGWSHICLHKPGGTTGERDRTCNAGFQHGEIKLQNL